MENLRRPNLPTIIWEVLEHYANIFPSKPPKDVPLTRKAHEFNTDLEDKTPPIHTPLYKLNPLELEEAKQHIQDMLEHVFIHPSKYPYGAPV